MKVNFVALIKMTLIMIRLNALFLFFVLAQCFSNYSHCQDLFKPIAPEFPAPNSFRSASGAPGPSYYQQRVDYEIEVELFEESNKIKGKELIFYSNNSPDRLDYLWVQLDQNVRAEKSQTYLIDQSTLPEKISDSDLNKIILPPLDGGFKIKSVKSEGGKKLEYSIVQTMMRVIPESPINPKEKYVFNIEWEYNINSIALSGGRSGFEFFEEDQNSIFAIGQFYPRMALYNDVQGWENKQFFGKAEFALEFGDFLVKITVPEDHVVGATGTLLNVENVLSLQQIQRFNKAKKSRESVFIVNESEAIKNQEQQKKGSKTWVFDAKMVRDFAFASSRKFIWEGHNEEIEGNNVFVNAMYPREANPLWELYAVKVVAHTLKTYSRYTFGYPYPQALAIHVGGLGIEYPMISFNEYRPAKDGSYSEYVKNRLIGLIIHEVGHNFFPMIVNSNERQWVWMDEGINSFLEYRSEKEWDPNFPSRRGPASTVVEFMSLGRDQGSPIMTSAENILNKGRNGYWKPAAALNILREIVLGPENFDFAFKNYANRWMFKHPEPSDFFRSMQDASAVDLSWFWRGWFYSTDFVDIGISDVVFYKIGNGTMGAEKGQPLSGFSILEPDSLQQLKNTEIIKEYYNNWENNWSQPLESPLNLYQISFERHGGIPMPIQLQIHYDDESTEERTFPAEVWKSDNKIFFKTIATSKNVRKFQIDPDEKSADINLKNNSWPRDELEKLRTGSGDQEENGIQE